MLNIQDEQDFLSSKFLRAFPFFGGFAFHFVATCSECINVMGWLHGFQSWECDNKVNWVESIFEIPLTNLCSFYSSLEACIISYILSVSYSTPVDLSIIS